MKTSRLRSATIVAMCLTSITITNAAALHVPADYSTIQACIEAAVSGEDECVVAPGRYAEVINFLGKGVTLRSSDGPAVTIIDATGIGSTVVKCINYEGADTVLRGFTITGGTGAFYGLDVSAGGMLNSFSSPTVIDCHFWRNTADVGAGMFNFVWSDPTIIDCTFSENVAQSFGGGIFNWQSSPQIRNSTFERNIAGGGGAIGSQNDAVPVVEGCVFRENQAYIGGALYHDLGTKPTLTDCVFERNTARDGGAIYSHWQSDPKMARVTFVGNTATNNGGALFIDDGSSLLAIDATFIDNHATHDGGAVYLGLPPGSKDLLITGSDFGDNSADRGGAVYVDSAHRLRIEACQFYRNEATAGGGVYYDYAVFATFTGCDFASNSAEQGGGIYGTGGQTQLASCRFEANAAEQEGGAVFNYAEGNDPWDTISIVDCTFGSNQAGRGGAVCLYGGRFEMRETGMTGNRAVEGGALYLGTSANEVVACRFQANKAELDGGAIHVGWRGGLFDHCTFRENSAEGGGAFFTTHTDPLLLTHCLFQKNTAALGGAVFTESDEALAIERSTFQGNGGLVMGGGITLGSLADAFVRHCEFSGNTSDWGGAIHNDSRGLFADHCTFAGNGGGLYGGAITNDFDAQAEVSDSVLWKNNFPEIYQEEGSQLTLRFCDVRGGVPAGAVDAGGNLDIDPQFVRGPNPGADGQWDGVDDDFGDLRLLTDSACIDEGDPSFVPSQGETDLEGHARVLCERKDIGAYEFGIGDFDCSRNVDLTDLAAWQGCVTGPGTTGTAVAQCVAFDFDANGIVDLLDFAAFQPLVFDH